MLKTAEQNVKKHIASVLMVQKGKALKKKSSLWNKSQSLWNKSSPMLLLLHSPRRKRKKEIVISAMHLDIGSEIASSTLKI
ncbi:hypothetical protein Scep_004624 [Stephania cephalantha]|uniref:Uncharacterized protein n=1 Tax=Stephania cephalantha TaxID=152367 RepID=A0AAP0PWT3_9MAGN